MAIATATATFNGTQDSASVSWSLTAAVPATSAGVCVSDGLGDVDVELTGVSSSGCTVLPTSRFTGTVEIIAMDV